MKVLICGAGIAGLTLASCLERAGHRAVVVERAPHLRTEGYMLDFFGSGYDASMRMGLIPELERIHYPIERLTFVDKDGRERLSIRYRLLRKRIFQDRHFNFMRGDLERVLFDRLDGRAEVKFGMSVSGFEPAGMGLRVRLSDGTDDDFDLLVGADGIHSHVRRLAFGEEEQFARFVGCYSAAFVLDERLREFTPADSFVTLTVPGRQVAVYPIREGRLAAFFVHRAKNRVGDFSREAVIRQLRANYGDMGWIVPELIDRAAFAKEIYFDAVSQIEMPSWSSNRVVLVGDACQCVSLLAGQGASMAVAGAYMLAQELVAGGERYLGAALATYERRLKPSIETKQAAGRTFVDWLVPENQLRLMLRDLGMRMSVWPVASSIVRRRMAAESIFEG